MPLTPQRDPGVQRKGVARKAADVSGLLGHSPNPLRKHDGLAGDSPPYKSLNPSTTIFHLQRTAVG